ncbi:FtsX-like permease family protein [Phycicoccus sp. HDW14]|uniref:FtsX-like permease family protein n=1 Tax=Phycicoccus sp. HDW14 TaxID=2714941 RepID=UPI001407EC5A|nr:FtsX-like permease family protein [Phycicoccus sp. HDW14]QIM21304.1 FtsX-like permease family protein [Phycicoccus sp. HDW14]
MGGARLLRRRLGSHPVAVAAIAVSVLASLVVVTALQVLSAAITDAGVRSALVVPPAERSLVLSAALRPGDLAAVDAAFTRGVAGLPSSTVTRVGTATTRSLPGRATTDRALLADVRGIDGAARLTVGRWPVRPDDAAARGRGRVEVALPDAAADGLGVGVGDTLRLGDLIDPKAPVLTVEVVGTFLPRSPQDGLWADLPLGLEGVTESDFTTYGPFVVAAGTFDGPLVGSSTVTWRATPDLGGVRVGDVDRLSAQVDDAVTGLRRVVGLPLVEGSPETAQPPSVPAGSPRVVTALPALVDEAGLVGDRVRVSLLTPTVLLVLLGTVALVGAAALLAALRDTETRLLRTRGASTARLAGFALGDAVVVAALGVLGTSLAAPVLAHLVAGSDGPVWSVAAVRDPVLWRTALPLAVLAVVVTVLTTLWVGRARGGGGGRTRAGGLRLAAGSGLDVVLVLLGVLAAVQLRRYDAVGETTVDPLTTAAPALVVAGLSVVCLRLLPVLARVAAGWGARRPGLDAAWGGWQFARRAAGQSGTLLLVLLAVAMGTIALGHRATVDRAITDQSAFDTGSPVRVVREVSGPASAATGDLVDDAAGGAARVSPVWRGTVDLGGVSDVTVLGVDARAAATVMSPRPDTLDAPWSTVTDRLVRARDLGGGVPLPGSPQRLVVTAKVVTDSPLAVDGFAGSVRVRDARGLVSSVPLGPVSSTQRDLTADLRGLGLVPPLAVVGVSVPLPDYVYYFLPEPTFDLVVSGLTADGAPVALGNELRPSSDRLGLWQAARAGAARPVPAVVTRQVADALQVGAGRQVTLPLGVRDLSITVVSVVDSLPTAQVPARGILLDLPTVEATPERVGGGSDVRSRTVLDPQEWWAAPADPEAAARVVRAKAPYGTIVLVADEQVRERLADPVNAGMRSAMLLVTLASVLLAGVGFAASTAALGRARRHENAVLLALGMPPGRIRSVLVLERVLVVLVTVLVGLLLGVLAAVTVVPLLVGGDGHPQVPSVLVRLPVGSLAGYALLLLLALVVVGAAVLRSTSRDLAGELREGRRRDRSRTRTPRGAPARPGGGPERPVGPGAVVARSPRRPGAGRRPRPAGRGHRRLPRRHAAGRVGRRRRGRGRHRGRGPRPGPRDRAALRAGALARPSRTVRDPRGRAAGPLRGGRRGAARGRRARRHPPARNADLGRPERLRDHRPAGRHDAATRRLAGRRPRPERAGLARAVGHRGRPRGADHHALGRAPRQGPRHRRRARRPRRVHRQGLGRRGR